MKITFFGSAQFGIPFLRELTKKSCPHQLVHIFTQTAKPAGRKRILKPTPVAEWAKTNSIPFTETDDINSPDMIKQVADAAAELLVVIAFGQKIGNEVIQAHPKGAINAHASLLPNYRGAAPINRAIMDGQTQTGVTIITLAEKMDAGQMLAKTATAISTEDTAETVSDKLSELSASLLLETISKIESGTAEYTHQDESAVTYAPKLKKSDGLLEWDDSACALRNKIHGLWPWPGARFDYINRKTEKCCRVTIAKAAALPGNETPLPALGTLDENMNVICRNGTLNILQIKPAGKNLMDFKAFTNGRDAAPGDIFLPISRNS